MLVGANLCSHAGAACGWKIHDVTKSAKTITHTMASVSADQDILRKAWSDACKLGFMLGSVGTPKPTMLPLAR